MTAAEWSWDYERPVPGDPYGGKQRVLVESEGDGLTVSVWTEEEGGFYATAYVEPDNARNLAQFLAEWADL